MELVCGSGSPDLAGDFERVGKAILEELKRNGLIRSGDRVLDVGCGCGRFAKHLLNEPIRSYVGFDRHLGMVEWSQREIQSHAPNFQFRHFNIKSTYSAKDNYEGNIDAASFQFPFGDAAFDFVLLSSVFTHMPLSESANYLRELHRSLSPEGRVVLSVFFTEGESYSEGINYYYRPRAFWDVLGEAAFCYHMREKISFGSHENWLVMTPRAPAGHAPTPSTSGLPS